MQPVTKLYQDDIPFQWFLKLFNYVKTHSQQISVDHREQGGWAVYEDGDDDELSWPHPLKNRPSWRALPGPPTTFSSHHTRIQNAAGFTNQRRVAQ